MAVTGVQARKTADPRRRNRHLIESDFNQLLSLVGPQGSTTFAYDNNGNQTQKVEPSGTTTYTWDPRDRLIQENLPGGVTDLFGYDTAGLRVAMQDSQGSKRVLLEGIEELAEYATGTGLRRARFDHDPSHVDGLLAQLTSQDKNYFINDALGSVYALADINGNTSARYNYDAFGSRSAALEQIPTNWGFTGRRHSAVDRSVIYSRSRYYGASAARFLAPDSTLFGYPEDDLAILAGIASQLINKYAYAANSPAVFSDPTGQDIALAAELSVEVAAGAISLAAAMEILALALIVVVVLILIYELLKDCEGCDQARKDAAREGDVEAHRIWEYLWMTRDSGHFRAIVQRRNRLADAVRRMAIYCSFISHAFEFSYYFALLNFPLPPPIP